MFLPVCCIKHENVISKSRGDCNPRYLGRQVVNSLPGHSFLLANTDAPISFFPSHYRFLYPNLRIGQYRVLIWYQRIINSSLHISFDFLVWNIAKCKHFASSNDSLLSSSSLLKIVASGSTAQLSECSFRAAKRIDFRYVMSVRANWANWKVAGYHL